MGVPREVINKWQAAAGAPESLADNFDKWVSRLSLADVSTTNDDKRLAEAAFIEVEIANAASTSTPMPGPQAEAQSSLVENEVPLTIEAQQGIGAHTKIPIGPLSLFFTIRPSKTGGLGAFANQDIPYDTKILWEPALILATNHGLMAKFARLSEADQEYFLSLYGYDKLHPNNRVASIFDTNKFRANPSQPSVSGLFPIASRFNHCCKPSCTFGYDMNKLELVFTTIQDIKAGEEITIDYGCGPDLTMHYYGFECGCGKCPIWNQKTEVKLKRKFEISLNWEWNAEWREEGCW